MSPKFTCPKAASLKDIVVLDVKMAPATTITTRSIMELRMYFFVFS